MIKIVFSSFLFSFPKKKEVADTFCISLIVYGLMAGFILLVELVFNNAMSLDLWQGNPLLLLLNLFLNCISGYYLATCGKNPGFVLPKTSDLENPDSSTGDSIFGSSKDEKTDEKIELKPKSPPDFEESKTTIEKKDQVADIPHSTTIPPISTSQALSSGSFYHSFSF